MLEILKFWCKFCCSVQALSTKRSAYLK